MRLVLVVTLMMSPAAFAQDLPFSPAQTEACLAQAGDGVERQVCIGLSASACINTPDGYTTVGMSTCLGRELEYWDGRLNAAYGALREIEEAGDAEMAELGSAAPKMAPALQEMQRAWIAFRDASCFYEVTQWGGGTGAGPAANQCAMKLTALQAFELERRLAEKSEEM